MITKRCVAALLLAAYLPACTAYHQTDASVVQVLAAPSPPGRICVTRSNGAQVEVWEPRVSGDTLHGVNAALGTVSWQIAIPLDDIQSTQVRKVDAGKTALAVLGIGLFLVGIGLLIGDAADNPLGGGSLGL